MPHKGINILEEHNWYIPENVDRVFTWFFLSLRRDLVLKRLPRNKETLLSCKSINNTWVLFSLDTIAIHHKQHLHLLSHQCFLLSELSINMNTRQWFQGAVLI
jgi:hypothetical protein